MEDWQQLSTLVDEVAALRAKGAYESSLPLLKTAVELSEKLQGATHPDHGFYLSLLAQTHRLLGQNAEALPYFLQAQEIAELNATDDPKTCGIRMGQVAAIYHDLGKYEEAHIWYERALEITGENFGTDHPYYGVCLQNLGVFYHDVDQPEKALTHYDKALKIAAKTSGTKDPDYLYKLNNLAVLYQDLGLYEKAGMAFLEIKVLLEEREDTQNPLYAVCLQNLGLLHHEMGDYDQALLFYKVALEKMKGTLLENESHYPHCLNNLSLLYQDLGQLDRAMKTLTLAKRITKEKLGTHHPDYGTRLNNLAILKENMGQSEELETLYKEALEIALETTGPESQTYANCLNNLAGLYLRQKRTQEALHLFEKSLNLAEKSRDSVSYGISLGNLATAYRKMERFDEALDYNAKALQQLTKNLESHHPLCLVQLNNLIGLYQVTGQFEKSVQRLAEVRDYLAINLSKNFSFLSEREKEKYVETFSKNLDAYMSALYDASPTKEEAAALAYDIQLMGKSLILQSGMDLQKRMRRLEDAALEAKFRTWQTLKRVLAREYSKPLDLRRKDLQKLEMEAEETEAELNRRTNLLSDARRIGELKWEDIRDQLGNEEVVVEFASFRYHNGKEWTGKKYYCALLLRRNLSVPIFVFLCSQESLDRLFSNRQTFPAALYRGASLASATKETSELYDLTWKPLEKWLHAGDRIYYSATGSLHLLSFAAIRAPNRKFLSDQYQLIQRMTTAELMKQDPKIQIKKISLFGGINYNATSQQEILKDNDSGNYPTLMSGRSQGHWLYLAGTLVEVENIKTKAEKHAVEVQCFTGTKATEESFKALDKTSSPNILHIATHGFFIPGQKTIDEKSLGGDGMAESKAQVSGLCKNPLLRSGLVFAGANHPENNVETVGALREDGILTAYEISQLYLPNTWLAVLSACETGLGDIRGNEGVFGLQRAFKMTGVHYLFMSLWKVADRETAIFMKWFYDYLFETEDIERSFERARERMKAQYRDQPYLWAGFILVK